MPCTLALGSHIITICTHMCTPIYDACFDLIILFSSVLHVHAIMPQCYMHAISHQSRIMFSNLSVIRSCLYITIVSYCIVRTAHIFSPTSTSCAYQYFRTWTLWTKSVVLEDFHNCIFVRQSSSGVRKALIPGLLRCVCNP